MNYCDSCEKANGCEYADGINFCDDCKDYADCSIKFDCCEAGHYIECNNGFEDKNECCCEDDEEPLWCEDCKHFCNTDMGGEGECDINNHHTWYGCFAEDCENFERRC